MTEALFDATRYGPGNEKPPKKDQPPPLTVENTGEWHLVLRHKLAPHALAHRHQFKVMTVYVAGKKTMAPWDGHSPWDGGWRMLCGLIGATVELPQGQANACPKCAGRPSAAQL